MVTQYADWPRCDMMNCEDNLHLELKVPPNTDGMAASYELPAAGVVLHACELYAGRISRSLRAAGGRSLNAEAHRYSC